MVEELNKEYGYLFGENNKGFFVRVNNVSLKYGEHKEGPYNNIRNILESIVSCIGSHSPLRYSTKHIDIYLIEWIDIKPEFEFRVFVHNNKITAISQQNIYSLVFENYVDNNLFNENIKNKLELRKSKRLMSIEDLLDEDNLEKVGIDISDIRVDWKTSKSQK
jgi:hypothetical protein